MKAYRRGEMLRTDVPWRRDDETGLYWFLGRRQSVRYPAGLIEQWRYRGAHHANQFSITAADIKERLDQEPVGKVGCWTLLRDGTLIIPNVTIQFPSAPETDRGVVMLAPPHGIASLPALVGDDDD